MARQYPMMGDKQLIIVKEAQDLKLNENETKILENYAENPVAVSYTHLDVYKRQAKK